MLRLSNICKYFGETLLFDQVSLDISEGEKVGVVGANGSGKSTLLKVIAAMQDADGGHVQIYGNPNVAYLPQHLDDVDAMCVGSYLAQEWFDARHKLNEIEHQLQNHQESQWCAAKYTDEHTNEYADEFTEEYTSAFDQFDASGGYNMEKRIEEALNALSISSIELSRPINSLSGGEKTKVALTRLLLSRADLMLLDEPTNNLDRAGMAWLEHSLKHTSSTCIIVSHDRMFLDRVTRRTLEIDQISQRITSYSGNYSWYKERKKQEEDRQLRQFKEQQIKIKRLTEDIRAVKNQALVTEKSTQNDYLRGRSKKVAAKAKAREARLTRIIELEKIDSPRFTERPKFSLSGNLQYASNLLEGRDLNFESGQSIQKSQLLRDINFVIVGSSRIAVTGDNGSGKSTLLKLIIGELQPRSGSISRKPGLRLGYLPQNQDVLNCGDLTVLETFKSLVSVHSNNAPDAISNTTSRANLNIESGATSNTVHNNRFKSDGDIRTLLHRFQFARNDVFKNVSVLSRGERTKLILASFMASELDLLIMDEPTNHLDLETIECFEQALNSYQGALIIVSHDRYFLEKISPDCIWHLKNGSISQKWNLG